MKFINKMLLTIFVFFILFSINQPLDIKAESAQSEYTVMISPGRRIPDKNIPENEVTTNNNTIKNKVNKPLPNTGMPAGNLNFNLGLVLVLIGTIIYIYSQESERYDEIL